LNIINSTSVFLNIAVLFKAAGACWYLLGIQRSAKCLQNQCEVIGSCDLNVLGCNKAIYYGSSMVKGVARTAWTMNDTVHSIYVNNNRIFNYGAYKWVVPLVTNTNRIEKVLFPIFWGLLTEIQAKFDKVSALVRGTVFEKRNHIPSFWACRIQGSCHDSW